MLHSDASSTASMQRRDSSPRSPMAPSSAGTRRPKLLRACATEPSVAAPSTTPRSSVVASTSPARRATDLLSRYSISGDNTTPGSPRRRAEQLLEDEHIVDITHDESCMSEGGLCLCSSLGKIFRSPESTPIATNSMVLLDSGNYYSFPSFDTWEPEPREKDTDMPQASKRLG